MAYLAIPIGDIDPESYGDNGIPTQLEQNWLGMFNGDSGAPRLLIEAIPTYTAGTTYVVGASIATRTLEAAGSVKQYYWSALVSGVVRIAFDFRSITGASGTVNINDGSGVVATRTTSSTTFVTATPVDVTLSAGEKTFLDASASNLIEIKNIKITTATGWLPLVKGGK